MSKAPASTAAAPPATVTRSEAIRIDGESVTKITLRKPKAGELRGLLLTQLMQMDVGSLIRLTPRISMPPMTEDQVAALPPEDLLAIGTQVSLFFVGKDQRAMLPAM